MDSLDFDIVKAEKASAMRRYNRLRNIAKLFRFAEICLALVFFSWTFTRLPFAVKLSGEYFRKLSCFIASPLFVFITCNVIIVTLVAKSGWFSGKNSTDDNADTEIYKEFIKGSGDRTKSQAESEPHAPEEEVYQDKQIICEVNTRSTKTPKEEEGEMEKDIDLDYLKVYRRTQSERFKLDQSSDIPHGKLRRTVTENCRKGVNSDENLCPEDQLSNEEFQRAVEAFIAKQRRFCRQESMPIVVHNQS